MQVVHKDIKRLHLRVYPPDGRVCVSAPKSLGEAELRRVVSSRLDWIRRKQKRLSQQEFAPAQKLISGEMHWIDGQLHRLEVIAKDGQAVVELSEDGSLLLRARPGTTTKRLQAALDRWYRRRLRAAIPKLIAKYEPVIDVKVAEWHIKKMKTRWGTCNPLAKRIWINLELAKRSPGCLEYIIVHEMTHLLERLHNARFKSLMDRFLPQWREHQAELMRIALTR